MSTQSASDWYSILPAPTSAWIEPCFSFRGKLYPGSLVVVNQHHALHLPNMLMVTRVRDIYDAPGLA